MKNSHSPLWLLSLLAMMCTYSCKDNSPKIPKFADWELDSLEILSPNTPAETYGTKGTEITQKWYITMYYMAEEFMESETDSTLYLEFLPDNSFNLSMPNQLQPVVKENLQNMFPEDYLTPGVHSGKYVCYDAEWCGCTCDGSFGVVLSDAEGNEFCRCAFIYMTTDSTSFTLKKVIMPDPMEDAIQTDTELKLHTTLE